MAQTSTWVSNTAGNATFQPLRALHSSSEEVLERGLFMPSVSKIGILLMLVKCRKSVNIALSKPSLDMESNCVCIARLYLRSHQLR